MGWFKIQIEIRDTSFLLLFFCVVFHVELALKRFFTFTEVSVLAGSKSCWWTLWMLGGSWIYKRFKVHLKGTFIAVTLRFESGWPKQKVQIKAKRSKLNFKRGCRTLENRNCTGFENSEWNNYLFKFCLCTQ